MSIDHTLVHSDAHSSGIDALVRPRRGGAGVRIPSMSGEFVSQEAILSGLIEDVRRNNRLASFDRRHKLCIGLHRVQVLLQLSGQLLT